MRSPSVPSCFRTTRSTRRSSTSTRARISPRRPSSTRPARGFEYFAGTRQGVFAVVKRFVPSGVHHILIGPDHLLFLVGLLLLGGSMRQLIAGGDRVHDRAQHHAVAGGAEHLHAAGARRRAGDCPQHRLRRRRQPDGARRARRPRVDCLRLRLHPRLRVRQRASRDGSAVAGARMVPLLVQPRRGNRPAASSWWRSHRRSPRCAHAAKRPADGSPSPDRSSSSRPERSGSFNASSFLEGWHETSAWFSAC